jgi:hypothetical protein
MLEMNVISVNGEVLAPGGVPPPVYKPGAIGVAFVKVIKVIIRYIIVILLDFALFFGLHGFILIFCL